MIQGDLVSTSERVVQLQEEIARLLREKRAVKSEKAKCVAEIKSLSDENAQLRKEIRRLSARMRDIDSSSDGERRDAEFQRVLQDKDRDIAALWAEIDDLRTEHSINSNAFLAQHQALADAVQAKQQMEQTASTFECDNAALATANAKLASENAELREFLQHLQKKCEQLSVAYSDCMHEKVALGKRHRRSLMRVQTLRGVKRQLAAVLAACRVGSADEFVEFIKCQRRCRKKCSEVTRALADVSDRNTKLEGLWRVQRDENDLMKNHFAEMLRTQQDLIDERLQLRATLERLNRRDRVAHRFEAANVQLRRDVNAIRAALSLPDGPSLRPLILVTLAFRRWQDLVGRPKPVAETAAPWSWMVRPGVGEILDAIGRITRQGIAQDRELDQLRSSCTDKDRSIASLSARVEQLAETEQAQLSRIAELEKTVEEQSEVIDDKIDRHSHDRIRQKYLETKKVAKETQEELKRRADRIRVLELEKHDADSRRNESTERAEHEVAVAQIREQKDELELIQHELHARNREIVALEKIITACRDDTSIRSAHVKSLARVGQGRTRRPRDAEVSLASQLREMAQNLSGTLCD
jgi:chromosome segregation ATPase